MPNLNDNESLNQNSSSASSMIESIRVFLTNNQVLFFHSFFTKNKNAEKEFFRLFNEYIKDKPEFESYIRTNASNRYSVSYAFRKRVKRFFKAAKYSLGTEEELQEWMNYIIDVEFLPAGSARFAPFGIDYYFAVLENRAFQNRFYLKAIYSTIVLCTTFGCGVLASAGFGLKVGGDLLVLGVLSLIGAGIFLIALGSVALYVYILQRMSHSDANSATDSQANQVREPQNNDPRTALPNSASVQSHFNSSISERRANREQQVGPAESHARDSELPTYEQATALLNGAAPKPSYNDASHRTPSPNDDGPNNPDDDSTLPPSYGAR